MPGRKFSSANGYRYGFNGKENDKEVVGDGNEYDYGMRIYNPRIGKFLSVDPLTQKFPWYTPYQYAGNKPIWCIDLDGAEDLPYTWQLKEQQLWANAKTPEQKERLRQLDRRGMMIATSMLGGSFVVAGTVTYGTIFLTTCIRAVSSPAIISSVSTSTALAAKYGPDLANFIYGAATGDVMDPVPTSTGSEAADAGVAFRNMFKKGGVILDFFGGVASRFKNAISIDPSAEFKLGGFRGSIEQFAEIFKGTKFKQIIAENPFGSYNYLNAAGDLLEKGGTMTVRGSASNKFFNKLLNGTLEGLENFVIESKKLIDPVGKTSAGKAIESKEYYEIILKRK